MKEETKEQLQIGDLVRDGPRPEFVQVKSEVEEESCAVDIGPCSTPDIIAMGNENTFKNEGSWPEFVFVKVEPEEEAEIVSVLPDLDTFFETNEEEEEQQLHDHNGADTDAFSAENNLEPDLSETNYRQKSVCDVSISVRPTDIVPTCTLKSSREKPFKCETCDKHFTQKSHLTQHRLLHSDDNPFKCDVCDKRFVKNSHLARHQVVHSEAKPFNCDICNKDFTQKSHLAQHQVVHTESRPFICDVCRKTFNKKSNLSRHQLVHFYNS